MPNGTYVIGSDLKIPSQAIIRGENQEHVVIELGNSNIIFEDDSGRATGINIENLTINHVRGQTVVTNSENCTFTAVKWKSEYALGDTVFVPENARCEYIIPTISAGGSVEISGTGVGSTITQSYSTSFSNTLNSIAGTLNASSPFSLGFFASVTGATLKISSLLDSAEAATVESNFTVRSQANNLVSLVTVTPTLLEYTDGSINVNASVYWENNLFGASVNNLTFNSCKFVSTPLAVESQRTTPIDSTLYDTYVQFKNCEFFE